MSQYILASFCNKSYFSTSPLVCVKLPGKESDEEVEISPVSLGITGLTRHATGLTASSDLVFVAYICEGTCCITALNKKDLLPVFHQQTPEIKDVHSICYWKEKLYILSTGTDEIFAYDLDSEQLKNPCVIWQASSEKKDTHHINSIIVYDDQLYISAFGPKTGDMWSSATNGYIQNLTSGARVKDDIYHPHTLSANEDGIFYCESNSGSFFSLEGKLFDLDGYARGATWLSGTSVCIATSVGRKVSKSTGKYGNPADHGVPVGQSGLFVKNLLDETKKMFLDLSEFSLEIYDLLYLEGLSLDMHGLNLRAYQAEVNAIHSLMEQDNQKVAAQEYFIEQKNQEIEQRNQEIEQKNQEIEQKNQEIEQKNQEIEQKNQEISEQALRIVIINQEMEDILSSKSWRLTAPLRHIVKWIKGL